MYLAGTKHWKIHGEAPIFLPYPSEQVGKNGLAVPKSILQSKPTFQDALHVGDVLYVPRGLVHEATTGMEASLHLTVAVPTYDWTVSRAVCDTLQTLLDGPGGRTENPWRRSVPFQPGSWAAMPSIFDKARLHKIIESIDLNHAQAVFQAKNAHHNERQEEALRCAESCSTARPPLTSSTELCWHAAGCTVDGFEDLVFVTSDGRECDLNLLLRSLPKERPIRARDVLTCCTARKRKLGDFTDPVTVAQEKEGHGRQMVAMGCVFARICFAAVCLESGLAAPVQHGEKAMTP